MKELAVLGEIRKEKGTSHKWPINWSVVQSTKKAKDSQRRRRKKKLNGQTCLTMRQWDSIEAASHAIMVTMA